MRSSLITAGRLPASSRGLRPIALAAALAAAGVVTISGITTAAAGFPRPPGDPPAPPGEDPRSPRPDIVAIVLDDVPPLDGRLWQALPNIRRTFVRQGLEFTDAHSETPTCTPGRAGLLTGQHSHHHGATHNDGTWFDPEMTVATALQAEGYHTIAVGKYLNLFERILDKQPPGWDDFHGYGGGYYDYDLLSNGVRQHYGHRPRDYSTDVIARIALQALERAPRDKPIFAWIAPYSMHMPWSVAPRHQRSRQCRLPRWAPPGYMERNVRDKPAYVGALKVRSPDGYDLGRICRGMRSVDEMVGRIVRQLDRLDRLENTMLVLTADNGMAYGSQRFLHDKKAPYGTRIPFFVHWERLLGTSPRKVDERVQNIDLAPTLCDIAGCRLGPYPGGQRRPDGLSLTRLLTGARQGLDRRVTLTSYQEPGRRVPTYWSVTTTAASPLAGKVCASARQRGCRWTYTTYATGEVELYDVSHGPCHAWKRARKGDPCMLDNVAGKPRYAWIERRLRQELERVRGPFLPPWGA